MRESLRPPVRAGLAGGPTPSAGSMGIVGPQRAVAGLVALAGLALAAGLVWHFINPDQIALNDRLAIPAAVLSAVLVSAGVFRWLGPAYGGGRSRGAETDAAAEQVREQLRQGRAVSWAGPVYLLPAGVQSNGRVYPWHRIRAGRADERGRQFLVYVDGQDEPVAAVPMAFPRFAAGRRVAEEMAAAAAESADPSQWAPPADPAGARARAA